MKFLLAMYVILIAIATIARAGPLEQDHEGNAILSRPRRATCDLLSASTPWVTLNHSACAAHCLTLRRGFKGGYCEKGVCHCRK